MSSLRRLTSIASHLARPLQPTASSFPSTVQTAKLGSALSTSAPREMSASVKEMVDKAIANNDVVVFSKTWCSFSRRAKQILNEVTDKVEVLELDETDEESQIQSYLRQLNGQGTVPHIYIHQQFIGGCSDLQKIQKSDLQKRIAG